MDLYSVIYNLNNSKFFAGILMILMNSLRSIILPVPCVQIHYESVRIFECLRRPSCAAAEFLRILKAS